MNFQQMHQRAIEIRQKYAELERKRNGKSWNTSQIMEGFVVDVGELMELVMAKEGARDVSDVDTKLKDELLDCLWSILVLADTYGVDLETSFKESMDKLEKRIESEMNQ